MDPFELLGLIQDALKLALLDEITTAQVDLGWPGALLTQHVWIEGRAEGEPEYDLSNGVVSGTVIALTVSGLVEFAGDYADTRAVLKPLWDAVTVAAGTAAAGTVDQYEFGKWRVKEGVGLGGARQLAFFRDIDFTKWLG